MVSNGYSYKENLFIAIDQLFSALFGYPCDECLSAVAYRLELAGKSSVPRMLIDCLFFFEKDHCKTSYESERARKHLPDEYKGL